MQVSYSRVSTFTNCPYQFKLRYLDKLEPIFNLDPANALVLGTAMHIGIEEDVLTAIKGYYSNYPSVTPAMINEAIKLEVMIEKARQVLPKGIYELKLETEDFVGYIDLLVEVEDGVYDLYDFKYSNNVKNYLGSGQLHIYKSFFEMLNPGKQIRNLYYVFIPKVKEKPEENEDIDAYRTRLKQLCQEAEINITRIDYNPLKTVEFLLNTKRMVEATEYPKTPNNLCYWCDYKNYCQSDGKNMTGLKRKEVDNM